MISRLYLPAFPPLLHVDPPSIVIGYNGLGRTTRARHDQHLGPNPLRNPMLFSTRRQPFNEGVHRMIPIIDIGLSSKMYLLYQYQYLDPLISLTVQQSPHLAAQKNIHQ